MRVPAWPHSVMSHRCTTRRQEAHPNGQDACRVRSPHPLSRVSSLSPSGRRRAGEVGDVVLRRMDDPILLVQINHRRLDIGVAQHGLDLPNRGAMVQGQRGGRMAPTTSTRRSVPCESEVLPILPAILLDCSYTRA